MKKTITLILIFIFLLPVRVFTQDFWINSPEYTSWNIRTSYYKIYFYQESGSHHLFFSPPGSFGIMDLSGLGLHSTGIYERNGMFFSANATNNQGLDLLMFFEGFFVGPFIFGSSVTYLFGNEYPSRQFSGMRTLIPEINK